MRDFPIKFEEKKSILMYPQIQDKISADILEIGPGRGDLLFSLATENPTKKFVAIEMSHSRYEKLIANTEKRALKNIQLIRADARIALSRYFEPDTFEKIFVLFPDPWPKNKHAFRRLLSIEWITLLVRFLKIKGELITATDVPDYANWIFANLSTFKNLQNTLAPNKFMNEISGLTETYFQKKWRLMGLNLHFMSHIKMNH